MLSSDEERLVKCYDTTISKIETKIIKKLNIKKNILFLYLQNVTKLVTEYDYKMSKKVGECKLFLKSFGAAKVRCMKDHRKPTIQKKPNHALLYVGANDLNSDRKPELFSKSILDLAWTLKSNSVYVSISSIIVGNDKYNEKGIIVNSHMKRLCIEKNLLHRSHKQSRINFMKQCTKIKQSWAGQRNFGIYFA